jgi:hypothetical protein
MMTAIVMVGLCLAAQPATPEATVRAWAERFAEVDAVRVVLTRAFPSGDKIEARERTTHLMRWPDAHWMRSVGVDADSNVIDSRDPEAPGWARLLEREMAQTPDNMHTTAMPATYTYSRYKVDSSSGDKAPDMADRLEWALARWVLDADPKKYTIAPGENGDVLLTLPGFDTTYTLRVVEGVPVLARVVRRDLAGKEQMRTELSDFRPLPGLGMTAHASKTLVWLPDRGPEPIVNTATLVSAEIVDPVPPDEAFHVERPVRPAPVCIPRLPEPAAADTPRQD